MSLVSAVQNCLLEHPDLCDQCPDVFFVLCEMLDEHFNDGTKVENVLKEYKSLVSSHLSIFRLLTSFLRSYISVSS